MILLFIGTIFVPMGRSETNQVVGDGTDKISGVLAANLEERWEDSSWIFFITEVPFGEIVSVRVAYSGDLDLDVMLFVDTDVDSSQRMLGWDISHCRFNYPEDKLVSYSQKRTTNTSETGEERVEYQNNVPSTINRKVYVLIYTYDGLGSSNYNVTSYNGHQLSVIPNHQLNSCILVYLYWLIFVGVVSFFSFIFIKYIKRKTMTEEQKRALEEKKKKKSKAKAEDPDKKRKEQEKMMKKRAKAMRR